MLKQCIIIGGGPAGTAAALAAVDAGLTSVLIVERDAFGGTCTNRGCIPTKLLLAKSEAFAATSAGRLAPENEWRRALQHKKSLVEGLSRSIEETCRARGVEIARGSARFVDSHGIVLTDQRGGGGNVRFEGERFIIAAGSRPAELAGSPCDGTLIITSDEALQLQRLPQTLAIIGSGAVGAEFAFVFTRLGVHVTLIEADQRLFPAEDPDVDPVFRKVYGRLGVAVRSGDPVAVIERKKDASGVAITLASGSVIEAEKALVAVGRSLASDGIACAEAGIELGPRGAIVVDDGLRTSQRHIYAAGDVTGRMLLAHAASYMGEFAGRAAAGAAFPAVPFSSIPWATFTSPEVAGVGLSLQAASRAGLDAVAATAAFMDNVKARIDRATEGFVKIVAERGTGRILGGTIVGSHASDLIHVLALAVHQGMTVGDTRGFVFAHPTTGETIGDAALDLLRAL